MHRIRDVTVYDTPDEMMTTLEGFGYQTVRKSHGKTYVDGTLSFDIETTNTDEDGFAYSFQGCLWGHTFLFRYIEDFICLIERIVEMLGLNENKRVVIYVHNLGYEHVYMTQVLSKRWGTPKALFVKSRKALVITYENIGVEFRDSLRLFQKSLASLTKGLPHEKLKGDLDYRVYRTPDTALSPSEEAYCIYDVLGLYEAIEKMKKDHRYNTASIPLTNTSMVLEEVDRHLHDGKTMRAMNDLILSKEQLRMAYNVMSGGDTHGTRWRAGQICRDCNSYDLKSAHPSQQILWSFPAGKPIDLPDRTGEEHLRRLIAAGFGWVGELCIVNPQVRPECPNPVIPVSKCRDILKARGYDNGRLMGADACFVYADSNDYQRIREAYTYDRLEAVSGFTFYLKYLPNSFRGAVLGFFEKKENAAGFERSFAKICVNTIFGAAAQKRVRDEYKLTITDDSLTYEKEKWQEKIEKEDVFKCQKNRLPFLWGLWTSSLTRLALFNLQKAVGWENVIYWDTDSVKFQGKKKEEVVVYNDRIIRQCKKRGAVVLKRGEPVYIGIAEDEHPGDEYGYREFVFLHAKCYAARTADGNVEVTISGVQKEKGVQAFNNDLSNMKNGFFIKDAGGLNLTYHDRPVKKRTDFKRTTETASYVVMSTREYLISGCLPDYIENRVDEIGG